MRYWPVELILKEFEKLADYGVETLRISDEMFFLNKKFYEPLLKGIIDRGLKFRMWSYSRVDTVNTRFLELFKTAGIDWLCLGIEAGNQVVRKDIEKGRFEKVNIRDVTKSIKNHGINILGNYIFGLPEDSIERMKETLDLAMELNTEHANFYPCQALPGSPLYFEAKKNNWDLPKTFEEYAFFSYECKPLRTNYCTSEEVLRFRDDAWQKYFTNPTFLKMIEKKFGMESKKNINALSKVKLKRKILES